MNTFSAGKLLTADTPSALPKEGGAAVDAAVTPWPNCKELAFGFMSDEATPAAAGGAETAMGSPEPESDFSAAMQPIRIPISGRFPA